MTELDLNLFYVEDDPEISEQARAILTQYSGVPDDELVSHVRAVRDKAWHLFKYPCIGKYQFLDFMVANGDEYAEVLERVKSGDTYLDLGCCFGQDVRKLVFDGAPAENIFGTELEQGFVDSGYDLFNDKDRLQATFAVGDFFAPETAGLTKASFDIIHASQFFHLFSWNEQVEAMTKALLLLKPIPGSMMFGYMAIFHEAKEIDHPDVRSGRCWHHTVATFENLVGECARRAELSVVHVVKIVEAPEWYAAAGMLAMRFCVRLM